MMQGGLLLLFLRLRRLALLPRLLEPAPHVLESEEGHGCRCGSIQRGLQGGGRRRASHIKSGCGALCMHACGDAGLQEGAPPCAGRGLDGMGWSDSRLTDT